MSTNKKLVSSLNPLIETRDVAAIKGKTGNLYESIVVASKRANQINITLKEELHRKLDDFANHGFLVKTSSSICNVMSYIFYHHFWLYIDPFHNTDESKEWIRVFNRIKRALMPCNL
ncbi:MAG: hypothetical protein EOO01_20280 [Chitinophagaceae bacterium]|nr:MAG: hypothetical protein EOO01_20280 [Chitinophagaceae bacterium]